jgi:hypothetical protein
MNQLAIKIFAALARQPAPDAKNPLPRHVVDLNDMEVFGVMEWRESRSKDPIEDDCERDA